MGELMKTDNVIKYDFLSIAMFQYSLLRSVQYKYRAIVYKAPGQNTSKIILASAAGNWDDGAVPLSNIARHSFAATLEHVVQANNHIKFLAYNNVPPAVPN
ncbi:hypothetical protein T08_8091, partial [Trichinella sp. T8]